MNTAALVVAGAAPPAAAARRQISTRAWPRRWSPGRRSGQVGVGLGADSGPRMASRTSLPSGSRRSRYSAIPSSSSGWERLTWSLSWSWRRWNSPVVPVGGDQLVPQLADLVRAVVGGDLQETRPRPSPPPHLLSGGVACPSGSGPPRRCGPRPGRRAPRRPGRCCAPPGSRGSPAPVGRRHRPGRRARTRSPTRWGWHGRTGRPRRGSGPGPGSRPGPLRAVGKGRRPHRRTPPARCCPPRAPTHSDRPARRWPRPPRPVPARSSKSLMGFTGPTA